MLQPPNSSINPSDGKVSYFTSDYNSKNILTRQGGKHTLQRPKGAAAAEGGGTGGGGGGGGGGRFIQS